MSLYLKYRPSDFKSIVGQEQVKDILKAETKQNKLSSSYIFFWPRWTWKTSTARILAKAINCTWEWEKPCNNCEACNLINSWKTLDFVEIDAASNTQVDKIREEIIDKAIYPPTNLKKKVYIIDEVHMLSKSAFNALLKIMEEPPEYLIFILATTEIHKVPETIISRCEVFNFKRISQENVINQLKYIADQEWIKYDEEGLKLIAKISDGGLRDAIKYLEQVSIVWEVNTENTSKFLWLAPERQIQDFLETVEKWDINEIFSKIEDLQNQWIDLSNFIKDILSYLDEHLSENIEKNLKLINLFDEVYQNLKNFPSPVLAYKTVLWNKLVSQVNNANQVNSEQWIVNNNWKLKNNEKEKIQNKTHPELVSGSTWNTTQKNNWNSEVKLEIENKKTENNNQSSSTQNQSQSLNKEELLKHINSPIVKWIIKNFGNVDIDWNNVVITIISQTNFTILNQADKKEELEKTILKLVPNANIEIKYMSKEEYFEQKLKN